MRSTTAPQRGAEWEEVALQHLLGRGLALRERNYRCRQGEIDLVMIDQETLVFVEVRYRKSSAFGSPAESVDGRKRGRLIQAAHHYLQRQGPRGEPTCRFDVVAISGTDGESIEWIEDAFGE